MATLKELSEETGFSITTISRVLSEDETFSVSESTKKVIFEVADKMNYKSRHPREIKNRPVEKCYRVGIIEMEYEKDHLKDSYYIYMRNSVEKNLFDRRIEPVSIRFDGKSNKYVSISGEVDGIIAIGQFTVEQIEAMEKWTENIVFIDSSPYLDKYTSILPNYETGVRQGLEYLYQNGHRHIAFAGVKYTLDSHAGKVIESRRLIFDTVAKEYPKLKTEHIDTPSGSSGTAAIVKSYFEMHAPKDRATAYFAFNEPTAIGILRAISEMGYKVPDDFSVLSYNDTALATMSNPPLTGIHIPMEDIAENAVLFLHRNMRGESSLPLKILVPTTMAIRESVKEL